MGQKVHPYGFRLGITKNWISNWFTTNRKEFVEYVIEDEKIRREIRKKYGKFAEISRVEIFRYPGKVIVTIHTSKPGLLIGKGGQEIENLQAELKKIVGDKDLKIFVKEVKVPELDAQIVADRIARAIENRFPYKVVVRKAMDATMRAGALGIKVRVGGRLGGADIARSEQWIKGSVPTTTITADIDYAVSEALTKLGVIGVKVWIHRPSERR